MTLVARTASEGLPAPALRAERGRAVAVRRYGGREYTYPQRDPRCKVCQSGYADYIERNILKSYGYTLVWNSLPDEVKERVSVRNITSHIKNHLHMDQIAVQATHIQRAEEIGIDIAASTQVLVDQITFAKVGLQKVYEKMVEGDLEPDIKDGIAFANFLAKTEETAGGDVDRDVLAQGFMAYMDAVRQICSPEQAALIRDTLAANPVLNALMGRETKVIEGETAEDDED